LAPQKKRRRFQRRSQCALYARRPAHLALSAVGKSARDPVILKDTPYHKGSLIYRNARPNYCDEMPASALKFVETVNRH